MFSDSISAGSRIFITPSCKYHLHTYIGFYNRQYHSIGTNLFITSNTGIAFPKLIIFIRKTKLFHIQLTVAADCIPKKRLITLYLRNEKGGGINLIH